MWNVATGESRQIAADYQYVNVISDDSRLAAFTLPRPAEVNYAEAVAFFKLPKCEEICRVPLDDLQTVYVGAFAKDGTMAIGRVDTRPDRNDWQNATSELRFWDVSTGEQLHVLPTPRRRK